MPFLDQHRWYELHRGSCISRTKTPAIFLDRDGVIIEEKHYLRDPEQVEVYPGVAKKIATLHRFGLPIVVVTNQSGIGQGLFGWAEYKLVHQRMLDLLGGGQPFTAVYANAHRSTEPEALWRKPNPGMILQAAEDLNICLASSVMVGDKLVDMEAGAGAGIKRLFHVRTGHGRTERPKVMSQCPQAELVEALAELDLDFLGTPGQIAALRG
jgi:D-glycero-D-manno-heptose 1,7-bisphosphate phosphatase